jgi:DNA (cytosine-5)-methyltransferase 1
VKAVSLFAGVGGFDLALERNGIEVVASVEIDKHAQKVLAYQFPNSQKFNDVREVNGEQLRKAGFDSNGIIVGGFPCQDLSVAGKRRGLAGERSGLFWEIVRLLKETEAKHFILENVPGLLSSNRGKDLGTVIGALAELGYGVAYRILDAQYFGVPQRRRRIFIVGCLGDDGRTPAQILAIGQGRAGYFEAGGKSKKNSSSTIARGLGATGISGTLAARDYKGISSDDLTDNKAIIFDPHRSDGVRLQGDTVNTLTSMMGTGGNNTPIVFSHTQGLDAQPSETNSPTLRTGGGGMAVSYPIDAFSSSSFADYKENDDVSATLRAGGGDIGGGTETLLTYPMHGAMIGRNDNAGPGGSGFKDENDPSYTLTSSSHTRHGVVIAFDTYNQTTSSTNQSLRTGASTEKMGTILQNSVIRRLTPVECERLQGFPDNWTANQADTHRYKQMGNAVAVPVVEWIIKNLVDFNDLP